MIIWIVSFSLVVFFSTIILYVVFDVVRTYQVKCEHKMIELNEKKEREKIKERLKNKIIKLDQNLIKVAAEDFMQALEQWGNRDNIKANFIENRSSYTEKELDICVEYEANYIAPLIKIYQPVYDAAVNYEIDQPFDFSGYIHSFFTGFYWSEIDYPEINEPIHHLSELLRAGLTNEEFYETEYYKEHLLPNKISERIEELKKQGTY